MIGLTEILIGCGILFAIALFGKKLFIKGIKDAKEVKDEIMKPSKIKDTKKEEPKRNEDNA